MDVDRKDAENIVQIDKFKCRSSNMPTRKVEVDRKGSS